MPTSWTNSARVYLDRRVLSILFFGFSSGLPLLLVGNTLSARLFEAGVSLTAIGFVTLVGLAYGLKFLWSPLVDRVPIPGLTRLLGRRRSWLLLSQICLVGAIFAMAAVDPSTPGGLRWTILWGLGVAFASATQDIAVDAYRTEILESGKLGAGAANIQFGYRMGMLAAGAGSLVIANEAGWFWAYAVMACLVSVGIVATLLNPEPETRTSPESEKLKKAGRSFLERHGRLPAPVRNAIAWFQGAAVNPFAEFMTRPGWLLVLLFVGFYKYGDSLLGVMANPFYLDIGFTKAQIGVVSKTYGVVMTLAGTALGGVLVARFGILKTLLVGGILQAASNLTYTLLAMGCPPQPPIPLAPVSPSLTLFAATIAVENLSGGLASAAFVAYLSSLCNVAFTATQYALLSSLAAFVGKVLASGGGWLADQVPWTLYFILTTVAAVPGIALLVWMIRRYPPPSSDPGSDPMTNLR